MTAILFIGGRATAEATYEGTATSGTTGSANTTVASVPYGAAASDREIFHVVSWLGDSGTSMISATIGGVAATIHVQHLASQNSGGGGIYGGVALISVPLAAGTSGTFTGVFANTGGSTWYINSINAVGLLSGIAGHTATATASGDISKLVEVNVVEGGVAFAAASLRNPPITVTGATEIYNLGATIDRQIVGAMLSVTATEAGRDITFTEPSGPNTSGPIIAAAFR